MTSTSQTSPQRTRLLLILLVIVALFALYRVAGGGNRDEIVTAAEDRSPGRATRPGRRGGGERPKIDPEQVRVAELHLAALDPQPRDTEVGRNLWQFYTPPPPPVQRVEPPPPRIVQAPPPPEPPPPVGPPPVVLPEVTFRYLGSFGPKARRIAVLEEGDRIINALEGDVLFEEFVVAEIGFESIYIAYKNHPDEPAKQLEIGG